MKQVMIAYHSQQRGNTKQMAERLAEGVRQVDGVEAVLVNLNEERVEIAAAEAAAAYALGSPNYFNYIAGGLKQFFDDIYIAKQAGRNVAPKPYAAFGSHGGGGDVLEVIERLAASMKLTPVAAGVACKLAPDAEAAERCTALGRTLAEHVAKSD